MCCTAGFKYDSSMCCTAEIQVCVCYWMTDGLAGSKLYWPQRPLPQRRLSEKPQASEVRPDGSWSLLEVEGLSTTRPRCCACVWVLGCLWACREVSAAIVRAWYPSTKATSHAHEGAPGRCLTLVQACTSATRRTSTS
jgi:hypothetical protein